MRSVLIYAVLAVVTGTGVALLISYSNSRQATDTTVVDEGSPPPGVLQAAARTRTAPGGDVGLAALEQRLAQETRARRELEKEVAALRRQVDELQGRAAAGTADDQAARGQAASSRSGDSANAWFDEQALVASGMDAGLAGELKGFFERLEFERLQLRDRAAREGWDRARRRAGLEALDERERQLRERLGDRGYDAYLYAAGRPNRVAVTSVLASAPAGQAGIKPGDYILRYDNQRIYDWSDLRAATSAGDLGTPVELEVERDGEKLQFYLTRGPLGVRTDSRSVAP